MYKFITAAIICSLLTGCSSPNDKPENAPAAPSEAQAVAADFTLPIPEGWRTETIPFPLEFAPELSYEGYEELRFSPGMFKAGDETFWSYLFVWWVPQDTKLSVERLGVDMERYFAGLAKATAKSGGLDISKATFTAEFTAAKPGVDDQALYTGVATTQDTFVANTPVALNITVHEVVCAAQDQKAVIFALSPQADGHGVWTALSDIRTGFKCGA